MGHKQQDTQPLLRYATHATHAPVYREIIDLFAKAAAGYASRLRPEDVHAALVAQTATPSDDDSAGMPLTVAEVAERLERLAEWGNLSRDHDSSRATTLDMYERVAYVYDLTPGGEAAHEALQTLEEGLRRVGGLQSVALRQIEELLAELHLLLLADELDGPRTYAVCEDLHARFKSLTGNAAVFMQKVNRLLAAPLLETAEFALLKAETIAYLGDFLADLDTVGGRIRVRLAELDAVSTERRTAVLAMAGVASGELTLTAGDQERSWAEIADLHLRGLAEWFRGDADGRAGAALLYVKARGAILGITRAVERMREAGTSPSSRSADLLRLADWFTDCANDGEAHGLWHVAFGLGSARHLGLESPDDELPSSTSWWDSAGSAEVPVRLRDHGRTDYVRRATTVPDRRASRQLLAAATADRSREAALAAELLVGLGRTRISQINAAAGPLEPAALRQLAHLISRAQKASPLPDGTRVAAGIDGVLAIRMRESRPPRAARLTATTGTWTLPDYTFEVTRRPSATPRQASIAAIPSRGAILASGTSAQQETKPTW